MFVNIWQGLFFLQNLIFPKIYKLKLWSQWWSSEKYVQAAIIIIIDWPHVPSQHRSGKQMTGSQDQFASLSIVCKFSASKPPKEEPTEELKRANTSKINYNHYSAAKHKRCLHIFPKQQKKEYK